MVGAAYGEGLHDVAIYHIDTNGLTGMLFFHACALEQLRKKTIVFQPEVPKVVVEARRGRLWIGP